ncbi:facilitated trehalose transporter Tret1-like isoform X2 [Bombyx mandarina]|uniref:Facilitated trehalose transporter Tret1-like isoform X2 n=1 Tax=Bombyx mandarina TaxID=7092 RepID=A0A6J2KP06_BOMMA|nr:facilitated trehalose transporter Tret1-like isoform X2 [Bombyx mandarina]
MALRRNGRTAQYLISLAVSLAAITAGVSVYWSTPMIPKFHSHEAAIEITQEEASWVASLSSPGYVVGSLASSFVVDRFGRRAAIIGSAVPMAVGTIILQIATKAWMLYMTRLIWGFSTGIFMTVSFIYFVEIADKEIRGKLSVAIRFMFNFGSFLVVSVGSFVSYTTLNRMLIVLPIGHFVACWFIPETPHFYIKEGKVEAAEKSLQLLHGCKDQNSRLESLRSDVKKQTRRPGTFKELFTGEQYRRAIVIVIGIKTTQIMSGSLPIQQYAGLIIQESHADIPLSAALISFGAVRFVAGIISSYLVDKVGRRPLLIVTYICTGVTLIIVGIYFYFQEVVGIDIEASSPLRYIPFVGVFLSISLSTIGYDSLVYIIPAEIFPINVKSLAITYLNIYGGLMNFLAVKGFQNMRDWTGLYGVFWYFAAFALLGGTFSFFMAPETKGKSLREILIELQGDLYEEPEERKLNGTKGDVQNRGVKESCELTELACKNEENNRNSTGDS